MKYDELVKSLHVCINQEVEGSCRGCAYVDVPFRCSYDLMGEAADAIEELRGVIQRQREMINATAYLPLYPKPMKWISVAERLPEENTKVLIVTERRNVIYGTFADGLFSDD